MRGGKPRIEKKGAMAIVHQTVGTMNKYLQLCTQHTRLSYYTQFTDISALYRYSWKICPLRQFLFWNAIPFCFFMVLACISFIRLIFMRTLVVVVIIFLVCVAFELKSYTARQTFFAENRIVRLSVSSW